MVSFLDGRGNDAVKNSSVRPTFEYNGQYYRVDEVCFSDKPFIVIEYGTYDELMEKKGKFYNLKTLSDINK